MANSYLPQYAEYSSKEEWLAAVRASMEGHLHRLSFLKAQGVTSGAEVQILRRWVREAKRLLKG